MVMWFGQVHLAMARNKEKETKKYHPRLPALNDKLYFKTLKNKSP
jgi:hypothetical protein